MKQGLTVRRLKGFGEFMIEPHSDEAANKLLDRAYRCAGWIGGWFATLRVSKENVRSELRYGLPIKLYVNGDNKPVLHVGSLHY